MQATFHLQPQNVILEGLLALVHLLVRVLLQLGEVHGLARRPKVRRDVGSTVSARPSAQAMIGWGKALLAGGAKAPPGR